MAVIESDVELRFTIPGAGPGDGSAGTAAGSLGGFVSTTQMVSATLHNLFDLVTGAENAASDVEYRCFAIVNTNVTDTWGTVTIWIASQVAGGASIAIGLDPAGVVAADSASAQGATSVNESTAPTGVTFSVPGSGSPLAIGSMAANTAQLVWVRRTAANTSAISNDGATITMSGTAD